MGQDNDKEISLATGYLDYLGTDKYTPEELKQEFYKLGISYFVSAGSDQIYVGISGLKENLPKGLELLEHLWKNAKPGVSESKILAEMQKVIFEGGGDYPANEFIIGSGHNALLCRYQAEKRILSNPDQLTIEWAGTYKH